MLIRRKVRPIRPALQRSAKPRLELLEQRTLLSTSWSNFGGNAQHTAVSTVAAQPIDSIHWQASLDLDPQPSVPTHYGEPVFTPNNTVIVPVKTGASGGFEVQAYNGATGNLLWTVSTDYQEPPFSWLPPFQPVYSAANNRVYFPGNGGTVYYVNNPDSAGATISGQVAFYGFSTYASNKSAFNSSIEIDTPLVVDNSGNVFFGFMVTGSSPLGLTNPGGGIARVSANGSGTFAQANAAAGGTDTTITRPAIGSVPALSNDGSILYVAVNGTGNGEGDAHLLGLNTTTLATVFDSGQLMDPRSTHSNPLPNGVIDESTASPMVAPDGTVFFGTFANLNNYNGSRGFLVHFSANLQTEYTPGAFGWDDTVSIIPASMVPSYTGTSTFLVLAKYNNYVAGEVGSSGGNGVNEIAILDPYATEPDPNNDSIPGVIGTSDPNLLVMKEILTISSPTSDSQWTGAGYPDAVKEWCTNGTAVDPFTDSVFINNEDGYAYRWDLANNSLTQAIQISLGISEPYTATAIAPDGTVYAINGGAVFALGGLSNYTLNNVPSATVSSAGQPVTFTTTLTSTNGGPTPTGTITYQLGSTVLSVQTLVNGVASYTTSSLPIAHNHIEAIYSGDSNYAASNTTLVQPVLDGTTTTLMSSANPSEFGESVTLTATVSLIDSTSFVPNGSVTFLSGNTVLGTASVNSSDQASFTTSALTGGNDSITAVYSGDPNFALSSSQPVSQVVAQDGTFTNAVTSLGQSVFGQSVTFTATISSDPPLAIGPTGMVSFFDGNTLLGMMIVSNRSAQFTTSALAVGSHIITADYSGDANYQLSVSGNVTQSVGQASTTTTAANVLAAFSLSAEPLTLSAAVIAIAGSVNEGTVTFTVFQGNTQIGSSVSSAVSAGNASAVFTLPASTAVGNYTIDATYNPGADYLGSSDDTHQVTVSPSLTTTTAASAGLTFGSSDQSVTLSATVSNSLLTVNEGTVTFSVFQGTTQIGNSVTSGTVNGGSASAVYTLPGGTPVGSYTIEATYNPGADFSGSSENIDSLTIVPASSTIAAVYTSATFGSSSQLVAVSATVGSPTGGVSEGTVTFSVFQGTTQIGASVTSTNVHAGTATANYILPAITPAGIYTLVATYNPSADYIGSGDGSQKFAVFSSVDGPPIFLPINGSNAVTLPYNQFPFSVALNTVAPVGLAQSFDTTVVGDSPLFDLQQQYRFTGVGYITSGAAAYVLRSFQPGAGVGGYYLIRPADCAVFAYDGSGSYSHTFSSGTPLATLGTSIYADPTLLLNAQPPVDYPTLQQLQQQYKFRGMGYVTAGVTAYVLQSTIGNNTNGNPFYLLTSSGSLYAYDGSGSFAQSIANGTVLANLGVNLYSYPAELTNAEASPAIYATLYPLQQQYDLQELGGSFYTNTYGNQAEWFYSPILNQFGQHWYTLTPDGTLRAWQGYADSSVGAVIGTLDTSVYSHPAWLTNATALPDPAALANVDGSGTLSIGLPDATYSGSFRVTVTDSDGPRTSQQTILVTATDTAPVLAVSQNNVTILQGGSQTFSQGSFPQVDTVTASAVNGGTITTSASVSSYDLPFTLEQRYQFKDLGKFTVGASAHVLSANANNSYGNPYYLLSTSGVLYSYDGSASYAQTFANVTPLATLGANYYADPSLLVNAQPAVNYAALYSLMQQYQFTGLGYITAGATAYVLHSKQPGPASGGYYLLEPDGNLYAYDGSGSYAHTIANSANLVTTLDPNIYVEPSLLLNAQATLALYSELSQLELQYDLKGAGNFNAGAPAYVLTAPSNNINGNPFYLLNTNGDLYAYDGSGSYSHTFANGANLISVIDPSVYANPSLLINAKAPLAASGVTATLVGGSLTLNAPSSFVGTFQIAVTATDGIRTSLQTFQVTVTDPPSGPDVVTSLTTSQSGAPLQVALKSPDPTSAPASNLLQQTQSGSPDKTANAMTSNALAFVGANINGAAPTGVGSSDGSNLSANTASQPASLTPVVYTNSSMAIDSTAPSALVSASNNMLTVNVAEVAPGTVFEVFVTTTDGTETTRSVFVVTVTA